MVYILLGDGFETVEALCPCDLMRRAGISVALTSVMGRKEVVSGQNITVTADILLSEVDFDAAELVMLPGGLGGVENILRSAEACELVKRAAAAGKWVTAICAAPTVLAKLGLLEGKKATVYPGMEGQLTGALPQVGSACVRDGKVITGEAAGSSFDFGLELVAQIKGQEAADKVRFGVHYR